MLRKTFCALALAALALDARAADVVLKVAASAVPHAEILNFVKPRLKAQGVDLQITVIDDYAQLDAAVENGRFDANFFQHQPYLDNYNKKSKSALVAVPDGKIHVEPFGAYSSKLKSMKDIRDGATVAIPNDPTNRGRALLLLMRQGLIAIKSPRSLTASVSDVAKNPKNLKFREFEAPLLPRALSEVDLALINTNYALQAHLNPKRDALFLENDDSPYTNIVVTRANRAHDPAIAKLVSALHAPETKQFILNRYQGAVLPAF